MANHASAQKSFARRMLSLLVIVAMMLSLSACGLPLDEWQEMLSSIAQNSTTIPTNGSQPTPPVDTTEPLATPPAADTQPTAGTDPTQNTTQNTDPTTSTQTPADDPAALVYTLTQTDVDEYYRLLEAFEALALVGEDMDAIDSAMNDLDAQYAFLDEQCSIALILHYSHTKDAALEKQYLDCVEICTQANDAYLQMVKRIYESDTPAKDSLFEGWTEDDFNDLLSYDEEIAALQQRNAEIGVEYRATEDDNRRIELYIEFVQNNNRIANYYGYDNYYTYSYEKVYDRDYDLDALEQMREFAQTYLVESYNGALMNFYNSFYSLGYNDQLAIEHFLYNSYDDLKHDYVSMYIDTLPGNMADALNGMLQEDSLFAAASDAKEGAFTTYIGTRSFCYFGPGYDTTTTIIHEGGHYYASLYCDLNAIPLDLAETHSQGNEWLFIRYMEDVMPHAQYEAMVDYLLYDNIAMTLICLMVDEFEQIVYSTDLTGFTAKDFDAIMNQVSLQYFPDGDVNEMLADVNNYWRMVVVDQPVYYISYAVSAVAAVSLYTVSEDDYDGAMAAYQQLCEEPLEDEGFLGNILSAGLLSPFDETFYIQLSELIGNRG